MADDLNPKAIWSRLKGAKGIFGTLIEIIDIVQDTRLIKIAKWGVRDVAKVKLNKRFHKRQYGEAFVQLNPKERDAIRDIHKALRKHGKSALENFVLNISLYGGDDIAPSVTLLKTLAQYSPAEAWELIEDMDLAKEPVHFMKHLNKARKYIAKEVKKGLPKLARSWNRFDNEVAAYLNSSRRRRWKKNRYGIEVPYYQRLGSMSFSLPAIRPNLLAMQSTFLYAAWILLALGLGVWAAVGIRLLMARS